MKYNKEELEKYIIIDKKSYEKIGEIYGCSGSNIKKVAHRMGIKLPIRRKKNESEHFNRGKYKEKKYCLNCEEDITHKYKNKYCDLLCQHEYQKRQNIKHYYENQIFFENHINTPKWLKPLIMKEQKNLCNICNKNNTWNDKNLVFILDHIDGNAGNNKRENLRCICPNCDSQLDTYKSKNKNSARKERYLKLYKPL